MLKLLLFFNSHESGIDNPFRPDGELSREADTIVSLIKEGKPITPVKGEELLDMEGVVLNGFSHDATDNGEMVVKKEVATTESSAPSKGGANGNHAPKSPGLVEVQRGVIVPPTDAPAVEQVVIKKKPKCKCCVIQ